MKELMSVAIAGLMLSAGFAFGDVTDGLENLKGLACTPKYSELVKAINPLLQETLNNISSGLKKHNADVERISSDIEKKRILVYPSGSAFDYTVLIPVEIVTKKGRKLEIFSQVEASNLERIETQELAIPLWVDETGANTNCGFVKGKDVPMGENDLTRIYVVDMKAKRTVISGLFGIYTASLTPAEPSNPPSSGRNRGPGSCIEVPPGMKCPACCPN